MASTRAYVTKAGARYEARWRGLDGKQVGKGGFRRKRDAQAYGEDQEAAKRASTYLDPKAGRKTVGDVAIAWLENHQEKVKPSTFHSDESAWRVRVQPMWGDRRVSSIRRPEVRSWLTKLSKDGLSATSITRARDVLAGILDDALDEHRISVNPARGLTVKRTQQAKKAYLTRGQVQSLAAEAKHSGVVLFLAYTGVRYGEMMALKCFEVDTAKRRITIERSAPIVNGHVKTGTPKTNRSRRVIGYPASLDLVIAQAMSGKALEDLLFGDGVHHVRPGNTQSGWFAGAVKRCVAADSGFPAVTPHGLRHTAASLMISSGANVLAVARQLGHASPKMTLDTYADLFDTDLDALMAAMDEPPPVTTVSPRTI